MAASVSLGSPRDLLSAPIHRRRPSGLEGTVKEQMAPDLILKVFLSFRMSIIRSDNQDITVYSCVSVSGLVYLRSV